MNCRDCKHWHPNAGQEIRLQGDAYRCNHPKLNSGCCSDGATPVYSDGLPTGNAMYVGPDFGCVHFEGVATSQDAQLAKLCNLVRQQIPFINLPEELG